MSDSKTGKEKLGDAAKKAEKLGDGLVKAGGLLAALAALIGSITNKD